MNKSMNKSINKSMNNTINNEDTTLLVNTKKKNTNKQILGQFYTTHHEYILQNMKIPDYIINIIEPFAGNGDLISFIEKEQDSNNVKYNIECYDIEPTKSFIIKQDTIKHPPNYNNKYLITNPPYLARNKCTNKLLFDKYDVNDLYKCVIKEILTNVCLGGIFIIPLNFWSSIRNSDINLRQAFLEKYNVLLLNIFEEQVFDDTTYTICSFQFELKLKLKLKENNNNENTNNENTNNENTNILNIIVYPSKTIIQTELNSTNNFMIGGAIYNLKLKNNYKITRLTNKNIDKCNTNILVKCIDDNIKSQIGLSFVETKDIYVDRTPNQTARTYASLIIEPKIDIIKQQQLVIKFNNYLEEHRKKYNSLFLTNYRESKDIARKRISFDLVYAITEYILDNFDTLA